MYIYIYIHTCIKTLDEIRYINIYLDCTFINDVCMYQHYILYNSILCVYHLPVYM